MSDYSLIEGVAAPLPIDNLDTDQIMPKQFLLGIDKTGLDRGLLHDLRFDADGSPRLNFILNANPYTSARILVGGANFGCGSSREHAVWGLLQGGFAAVLAPSFGEIFHYNAVNNRLLTIVLEPAQIAAIAQEIAEHASCRLAVDVENEEVRTASGRTYRFRMNPRHRRMHLDGLDVIGATLRVLPDIEAFERKHLAKQPWTRVLPLGQVPDVGSPSGTAPSSFHP